ncbi:hypothetical protein OIU77_001272 [Salix suchowensis]|uniref:Amine oxidase domain-containing protein n=1 Tax=Salix suchowensis TaxID=1278906 RepID=A0ABQ9B0V2_9ROSI|nr:hypothetical protein OIU77_001272 [Salix suchowensis]
MWRFTKCLRNVTDVFIEGDTFASQVERQNSSIPTVIVIGGGISGLAAARILHDASFKVVLLESRDRLGGRIHTDYSFGYPVDLGASWLHGVCNENPLAPLIRGLGLKLYRTSGDNSVLYDHDLERKDIKFPQQMVIEVGDTFKRILEETEKVRDEHTDDMSVLQAIWIVLDKHPELRQEGLANEVLQWYICRMEAWFAADADMISLKSWDQEQVLSGGHGLMVQGYDPIIKTLAKDIDIRLNHRVTKISNGPNKVATVEDLELLGIVAPTSYACGYFLNLHKATGHPVLVYMAAGRFAYDLEKLSDDSAAKFVMLQLKKMFPNAKEPVHYLVTRWGTDPNSLGCYSYDLVGKPEDSYERLRTPLGNLFFGGEAVSMEDHQGSVHGAYSAGIMAAENCQRHLLERLGYFHNLHLVPSRGAIHDATFPLQISRM